MAYPPLHRKGANVLKTKAQDWADLFADVRKGAGIQIEGYERRETRDGVKFARARNPLSDDRRLYPDKYVVITETPSATAKSLKVREVRYLDFVVKPCATTNGTMACFYAWYGEPFDAFPIFGLSANDYGSEVTKEITDATVTPPSNSTILRCFRNHDSWIVDRGGRSSISLCVVRAVWAKTSTTPYTVLIHLVHRLPDGGLSVDSSESSLLSIESWPGTFSEDYRAFQWDLNTVTPQTQIIPLYYFGGRGYVQQLFRRHVVARPPNARVTDCVPTGASI